MKRQRIEIVAFPPNSRLFSLLAKWPCETDIYRCWLFQEIRTVFSQEVRISWPFTGMVDGESIAFCEFPSAGSLKTLTTITRPLDFLMEVWMSTGCQWWYRSCHIQNILFDPFAGKISWRHILNRVEKELIERTCLQFPDEFTPRCNQMCSRQKSESMKISSHLTVLSQHWKW
jgi:hypothetical protein